MARIEEQAVSGLFKAGDAHMQGALRPLEAALPAARQAEPFLTRPDMPEPDEALDRQCIELEAAIVDLRHRIAQMETEADQREEAAFERGRQDGLDHVAGEENRRLDMLAASLERLQPTRERILADCETLALQLSRTALKRVFGEAELQADLLRATLTYHLSALQRDMVRQVRVSGRDFRSADDLATLGERFPGLAVIADDTLQPGDCKVDLRLGSLDIGLAGQWQRLSVYFDQLAQAEAGAAP